MSRRLLLAVLLLPSLGAAPSAFGVTIEYALDRNAELVACDRAAYRGARAEAQQCYVALIAKSERPTLQGGRRARERRRARRERVLPGGGQAVSDGRGAARALGRAVPRDAPEQRGGKAVRREPDARRALRAGNARPREGRGGSVRGEGPRPRERGDREVAGLEPRGVSAARAHRPRGWRARGGGREARQGARDRAAAEAAGARDRRAQGVGGPLARQDR